ncbi:MAG: hypothetical protein KAX46_10395, partial [Chromatiaceae bacterium]|nr:hypothetical protein [Chromatiaceae bacterium]
MPRRLGLHHLALFRGHLDGVDLATLGERYLDTGADLPKAKATLRWIRDALIAAARKERPGLVKLLRIPLARIAATDAAAPSLEDFQAEHDPQGFYDERDLIEEFKKAYPVIDPIAARQGRRNQRLRQRLREAVAWLEERVAQPPRPGDSVFAWIDDAIAARLAGGGIHTLSDLVTRIRKKGTHWHRALPQIGPVTARRLEQFVLADGGVLADGNVLPLAAVRQDQEGRPAQTGIVPLERFAAPTDRSGALGANRSYATKLAAADDRAA